MRFEPRGDIGTDTRLTVAESLLRVLQAAKEEACAKNEDYSPIV